MRHGATFDSRSGAAGGARRTAPGREPSGPDERTRAVLLTVGVVGAAAVVWGFALGVLDRAYTPQTASRYASSASARVERRPVLFALCGHTLRARDHGTDAVGIAVPIAAVDPGGALRAALVPAETDEARRAETAAFAATYCRDTTLRVLSGGAFAGTLRLEGSPDLAGPLPLAHVAYGPNDLLGVVESTSDDLLGISDPRFGVAASGARPMQAQHRVAAEQLARAAVRERYPDWPVESVGPARVRVADLDRSGTPELLASVVVVLRVDARHEATVALFLIGEPGPAGSAEPFRLAYVAARETSGPGDGFAFLDQVDLTPAPTDEVVVRSDEGDAARYLVLARDRERWYEAVATPPVSAP